MDTQDTKIVNYKRLVKSTYNRQAQLYKQYSDLQKTNLINLLKHAKEWNQTLIPGLLLDAGCGIPDASVTSADIFKSKITEYVGLDLSLSMLLSKPESAGRLLVNADLEAIPFPDGTFAAAISNTVLHWLNAPEIGLTPVKAVTEIRRVLSVQGVFLLSVAGTGTATRFRQAYQSVIENLPDDDFSDRSLIREDPIGCMTADDVEDVLKQSGFQVHNVSLEYEPVAYERAEDYVSHVKAYGEDAYLAPFKDGSRDLVWKKISTKFLKNVGEDQYVHDQYMVYATATPC